MNQTESRIFGFFVTTLRKKNNWTLEALAHNTNYSYSMIRSIEKGTSNINEEGRNRFANIFGFKIFQNNMNKKEMILLKGSQSAVL